MKEDKKMKKYQALMIEIKEIEIADIVRTSLGNDTVTDKFEETNDFEGFLK